jgi:CheY-like chemotaxis protein
MPNPEDTGRRDSSSENGKLRVLVVDDDENIREILKDLLLMSGHHVILCSNGEEALQSFYEEEFDLVITDLGMPGISGWEVTKRIKRTHPQKPVVIISGWGAQLSEEEIRSSQVDLVLPKPFNLDQILEITGRFADKTADEFTPEGVANRELQVQKT